MTNNLTTQLDSSEKIALREKMLKLFAYVGNLSAEQLEYLANGRTVDGAKTLDCAQVELMLQTGRRELSGVLTAEFLIFMLKAARQGKLDLESVPLVISMLREFRGVEQYDYKSSPVKKMVNLLLSEAPAMVALMDLLSQLKQRSPKKPEAIARFLTTLGIELREERV
ncbi:hypothetical protein [Rhodoferax sp.]|uniref:hypothetical protein n=1 Tax=Rhodoferax sp. TaxID=50421 RepID=UPI00374D6431